MSSCRRFSISSGVKSIEGIVSEKDNDDEGKVGSSGDDKDEMAWSDIELYTVECGM